MRAKTTKNSEGERIWEGWVLDKSVLLTGAFDYDLALGLYEDIVEGLEESKLTLRGSGGGDKYKIREFVIGSRVVKQESFELSMRIYLVRSSLFGGAICYDIMESREFGGVQSTSVSGKRLDLPMLENSIWLDIRICWTNIGG